MKCTYEWPTDVLGPLIAEVRRTSEAWHAAPSTTDAEWKNDWRDATRKAWAKDALRRDYYHAREQASLAFAAANGWRVGHQIHAFSLAMLREGRDRTTRYAEPMPPGGPEFDHAEFLKVGRMPVAIIVHNYNGPPPAVEVQGLRVEQLPECWYWPDVTTAWLIRRECEV